MEPNELRARIQELHALLAETRAVDEETGASLREVLDDIETLLASTDDAPPAIVARMREAAAHFEAEHPSVAAMIARITDALAKMGI